MFANTFQSGFISVFYSVGSNPLQLWDKQVKNGHIRRVVDDEVRSLVLEISGTNVATTYITCPIKPRISLGIKLPFLVMIIKNMKKYFTFEIQILDDKDMHRRFRVSNFQSTTKVRPFCTTMPIGLSSGWNQIQFNLADFTKRAYGSTYLETTRVQIHANVRIRRIYFADMLYSDEDLPNEYKLFLPTPGGPRRPPPKKTDPKAAEKEKGDAQKPPSVEKLDAQAVEEAIPSGAPPTPAGPIIEASVVEEQPVIVEEVSGDVTPVTDEPISESIAATEEEHHLVEEEHHLVEELEQQIAEPPGEQPTALELEPVPVDPSEEPQEGAPEGLVEIVEVKDERRASEEIPIEPPATDGSAADAPESEAAAEPEPEPEGGAPAI